jgi:hypothetical protein
MTTGNSSSENSNIQESTLPQVSEYCLLFLKETRFLLLDVSWLFELYSVGNNENGSALQYLTSLLKFEDFLDQSLINHDTTFVYELIEPALEENTLSDELYTQVCCLAEKLYLDIHTKICESLIGSNFIPEDEAGHDHLRLVGFFSTTAIISIGDLPAPVYPTFEEAYGRFGITKWRDSVSHIPVLETFVPFIQGQYSEPGPL